MTPGWGDATGPSPVHELGFWRWWSEGIVAAGVHAQDLPTLSFPPLAGAAGLAAGEFRVRYDTLRGRLYTTIEVRADLCSSARVRYVDGPAGAELKALLEMGLSGMRTPTHGVLILALQCAHYEQFAWRFRERTEDETVADRAADRRAAWLVRRWKGDRPRYRPPGFSRRMRPVRCAGLRWREEDGRLVGEPVPD
jgi:hypothetical protein